MYYSVISKLKKEPLLFIAAALSLLGVYHLLSLVANLGMALVYTGVFIGIFVVILIYNKPFFAVLCYVFSAFLMFFICYRILKLRGVPLGFVFDGLAALTMIVLLLKKELSGFKTTLGLLFVAWFGLCLIEVANPLVLSRVAWAQSMRQTFLLVAPFFLFYSLFKTQKGVLKYMLYTWIALCTFAAVYTLYQEFVGLPPWDYDHIHKDEQRKSLYYTFGRLRKIAFLDNPTENGLLLCSNFILCFGLAFNDNNSLKKQIAYLVLSLLSLWSMMYTGTRTASVLFLVGPAVYILIRRKKSLFLACGFIVLLGTAYVIKTGGGGALSVMSTAFDGSEDPSLQLRFNNQRILRKYLYRAPIGYGMGSTGFLGEKYTPYTFLGSFPPDSEFVKIIIEVGYTGLILYLAICFMGLNKNAEGFGYKSDPYTMNYQIVNFALLMIVIISHYPQEIMSSHAFKILFGMTLAYANLNQEEAEFQSPTPPIKETSSDDDLSKEFIKEMVVSKENLT